MEYYVGQKDRITKTITESDIRLFSEISGDINSIHIDDDKAKAGKFKRRVAHGALINALISAVLGTKLPGDGTIYISQTSRFLNPVFIGETVTAEVEITEIKNNNARLRTTIVNESGEMVIDGEALVLLPQC